MTSSVILPAGSITQTARGGAKLLHELVEARGAGRAVLRQRGNRLGVVIVDDRLVAVLHQAARDVAAHAPETDHADLHVINSVYASARSNAASSAARPDSTSPLR